MELLQLKPDKKIQDYSFSLKASIGKGSSGTVYIGKDERNGEPVAVKVIDMNSLKTELSWKNLKSEIETMRNLNNPHIVKLLGVYQTTNNAYIITEYCNQGDLRNLMNKRKRFSEKESISIIKQILLGVKEFQQNDIIHRDLKPANVLIHNNVFKITDFGFARKVQNENHIMDSLVGTPLYMCPQILLKQKYNTKSDIWSIALIFYELLYGTTPWPSNNLIELVSKISQNRQIYFDPMIPVSNQTKNFIVNCLKISQEERYGWEQVYSYPLFNIPLEKTPKSSLNTNKQQQQIQNQSQQSTYTASSQSIQSKQQSIGPNNTPLENNQQFKQQQTTSPLSQIQNQNQEQQFIQQNQQQQYQQNYQNKQIQNDAQNQQPIKAQANDANNKVHLNGKEYQIVDKKNIDSDKPVQSQIKKDIQNLVKISQLIDLDPKKSQNQLFIKNLTFGEKFKENQDKITQQLQFTFFCQDLVQLIDSHIFKIYNHYTISQQNIFNKLKFTLLKSSQLHLKEISQTLQELNPQQEQNQQQQQQNQQVQKEYLTPNFIPSVNNLNFTDIQNFVSSEEFRSCQMYIQSLLDEIEQQLQIVLERVLDHEQQRFKDYDLYPFLNLENQVDFSKVVQQRIQQIIREVNHQLSIHFSQIYSHEYHNPNSNQSNQNTIKLRESEALNIKILLKLIQFKEINAKVTGYQLISNDKYIQAVQNEIFHDGNTIFNMDLYFQLRKLILNTQQAEVFNKNNSTNYNKEMNNYNQQQQSNYTTDSKNNNYINQNVYNNVSNINKNSNNNISQIPMPNSNQNNINTDNNYVIVRNN
ncbi:Protein kinase-like domain [Pseudocohnilembus persalinus]|uniref:Protein kinase-like domain n=1 Tax=Pseudocohnilembus persalinus TaxID=266149 RepID=A0A0V0QMB2_PSEPJ|nr:Protein kinase-like domain [Pseudocohnilembus persalinus]|eukprot:KRX03366.1 Protein kinase-like domain [Pseudocohnilembus persalinus]